MDCHKIYKRHYIRNEELKDACHCALGEFKKEELYEGREKVKEEMQKQFGFDMTIDMGELMRKKEEKKQDKKREKIKQGRTFTFTIEQTIYIKEKGAKMMAKCKKDDKKKPVKIKKRLILKKCEPRKKHVKCSKQDHMAEKLVELYRKTKFSYRVATYANQKWKDECGWRTRGFPKGFTRKNKICGDADDYILSLFKKISAHFKNPKCFPKNKNEDYPSNYERIAAKVLRMILKAMQIIKENICLRERLAKDYLEKNMKLAVFLGCKFDTLAYNEKKWNLNFIKEVECNKAEYRRACFKHCQDDDDKKSYF